MRGRPPKADETATPDDTLRRARGRAAQRRYRNRKARSLAEALARNAKFEVVVEGMAKALLNFGENVLQAEGITSNEVVGPAYRQAVQSFLSLTTQIDEESEPRDQSPKSRCENVPKAEVESTPSIVRTSVEMETSSCSSDESPSPEAFPLAKGAISTDAALDHITIRNVNSLPPGIILMPTQNPLFFEDYSSVETLSYREPTLWKRLLHHGMLRSYRALECASDLRDNSQSWLARTHRFSLRHASRWHLLFLSKSGLDRMIAARHATVYGPVPPSNLFGVNGVLDTGKHRELGDAVRNDLEREGLWENMLRSEEVDEYMSTKGTTKLVGNRLELRLFSSKGSRSHAPRTPRPDRGIQTVILDAEMLVWKICEDSICMGDGIAYPKNIINKAIVYSAVHIDHDIWP